MSSNTLNVSLTSVKMSSLRQAFNNFGDAFNLGSVRGKASSLPGLGSTISLAANCKSYINGYGPILLLDANNYSSASSTVWPDSSGYGYNFTINANAFSNINGINYMNLSSSVTGCASIVTPVPIIPASGLTVISFSEILNSTADYRTLLSGGPLNDNPITINTGTNSLGMYNYPAGFYATATPSLFDVSTLPSIYTNFNMLVFKLQNSGTSPYYQVRYNGQSTNNFYSNVSTINSSLHPSNIKYIGGSNIQQFWGNIGLVAIYNSILSDGQISDLYNRFSSRFLYNTPPVTSGLIGYYTGESWTGTQWTDLSGNANHAVTITGTIKTFNNTQYDSSSVSYQSLNGNKYLGGGITAGITFPSAILPQTYTLLWVARYAGINETTGTGSGTSLRIFDATTSDWLSGFNGGLAGVAKHGTNYVTQNTTNIYGNNWIIGSDQTNLFRANGANLTISSGVSGTYNLTINNGFNKATQASDWMVAAVLVYSRELLVTELNSMETFLAQKYNLTSYLQLHQLSKISNTSKSACVGAYALYLLSSSYTGPVVKIRNNTNNIAMDFYADINGTITIAPYGTGQTLTTWLGGSVGTVDTWYDQSGNGNNAITVEGTSYQPTINVGSNIITFNGANRMQLPSGTVPIGDSSYSVILKHNAVAGTTSTFLGSGASTGTSQALTFATNGVAYIDYWNGNNATSGSVFAKGNIASYKYTTGAYNNRNIYINGTQQTYAFGGGATTVRNSTSANNYIGYGAWNTQYLTGDLYWLYIFNNNISYTDENILEGTPFYVPPITNFAASVSIANAVTSFTWSDTAGYQYLLITSSSPSYTSTAIIISTGSTFTPSGLNLTANTSSTFTITPYYYLNTSGNSATAATGIPITSAAATLILNGYPSITAQPTTNVSASGTSASQTVNWTGSYTSVVVALVSGSGTVGSYGAGTVTVTALTPNTSYSYTITPWSGASGTGLSGTPQTTTALVTLATISATPAATTSAPSAVGITITWPAAVAGNYSTVTITSSPTIAVPVPSLTNLSGTSVTITSGLSASTAYTFTITPNNSAGVGNSGSAITCSGTTTTSGSTSAVSAATPASIVNAGFETTAVPIIGDPYYSQVVLMLRGDGSFADSSLYGASGNVGANVATNSATYLFGSGSLQFSGGTGTASYYYTPTSSAYTFGANNFTIEFWYNLGASISATSGTNVGLMGNSAQGTFTTNTWQLYFNSTSGLTFAIYNNTITLSAPAVSTVYTLGSWNHVAVVRNGTILFMFINGTLTATTTIGSANMLDAGGVNTNIIAVGASGIAANTTLTGFIDDLRVTIGTARYVATFLPATLANPNFAAVSSGTQYISTDPYGQFVALLLHGSGVAGSTTIIDSSKNGVIMTASAATVATISNTITKFGSGSINIVNSAYSYFITPSTGFSFGTQNFTIEFWIYFTSVSSSQNILGNGVAAGTYGWGVYQNGTGSLIWNAYTQSITASFATINTWTHLAFVRNGQANTIYINGVSSASGTATSAAIDSGSANTLEFGSWRMQGTTTNNNYFADIRVTIGVARYTNTFTVPTQPFPDIYRAPQITQNALANGDPYWQNVVMLLHGDGQNGSTQIVDSSQYATQFSAIGTSPNISTNYVKIGNASIYFPGSSSALTNYLASPVSSAYNFGTKDFTIECWFYGTSANAGNGGLISGVNGTAFSWGLYVTTTPSIAFYTAAFAIGVSSSTISFSTWYHIAVVKYGTTITLYLNGVSVGTPATLSASLDASTTANSILLGTMGANTGFTGYLSQVRITIGVARYTSAFTLPNMPSPNGAQIVNQVALTTGDPYYQNTVLLMHGDNNYNDYSRYLATITPSGSGQIYITSGKFGSAFQFQSSSYLTTPTSSTYTMGTQNFTIEFWFYSSQTNGGAAGFTDTPVLCNTTSVGTGNYWYISSNGCILFFTAYNLSNTSYNGIGSSIQNPWAANVWNHVAFVRNGNSIYSYSNGILGNTATYTYSMDSGTNNNITIGGTPVTLGTSGITTSQPPFPGYIDEIRVTIGVARYTANFIIPTSSYPSYTPMPSGTDPYFNNVALLLHGDGSFADSSTNAAILTATGTVTSTLSGKFGTAGLYFASGTSTNYLSTPSSPVYTFGTQNFTIECWFYNTNAFANAPFIFGNGTGAAMTTGNWFIEFLSTQIVLYYFPSTSQTAIINTAGTTINSNQWYHLAIVRNGTTITSYLNGTLYGVANTSFTASLDSGPGTANTFVVGCAGGTTQQNIAGYIDEVRVTIGVARYTTNFAVPTAPYPNASPRSLTGWSTTANAGVGVGNPVSNSIQTTLTSASTIAVSNAY